MEGKSIADVPDMLAFEVGRVHPTQGQLPSLLPLHIPVQPKAEHRILYKSLVDHVIERGHGSRHCYLGKA